MSTVQANRCTDELNNDVSSTSSEDQDAVSKFNNFYKTRYAENAASDNEVLEPRRPIQTRAHYKSMTNINEAYNNRLAADDDTHRMANSISNVDISLHDGVGKYESLQIPIVGYEVMEERARFTIFKLRVCGCGRAPWLVFRRYTDFVRLHARLRAERRAAPLPLPGKRWFGDNFEPAFLDERVRGLQVFVDALLATLPSHPLVREFFCLDEPPPVFSYQPEVQAVYGALEDSITSLKVQLKQKDATISHLQKRLQQLENEKKNCPTCSTNINNGNT